MAVDLGYNVLSNYKIEKKIGRGQFSTVFRAIYLPEDKHVALKQVPVSSTSILKLSSKSYFLIFNYFSVFENSVLNK